MSTATQEGPRPLNLFEKLNAVYKAIDHIEKKGRNKAQGYDFVRSADVLHAMRKAFLEWGLYAAPNFEILSTYEVPTNSGRAMHAASVKVTMEVYDIDSKEHIPISGLGDGADSGDKGIYKAQTGAVKNALRNAFLVPDEADPEADESVDRATEEAPAPVHKRLPVQEPTPAPKPATKREPPEPKPIPENGNLPDEQALEKYRQRVLDFTKKLTVAGLKANKNLPVSRKIVIYLLSLTGAAEIKDVTVSQWEAALGSMDKLSAEENGLEKLAKTINSIALKNKEI